MIQNFGEPLFFVIRRGEGEALSEVKEQIKKKLQIPDEEFCKWNFSFPSLGHPKYLQDADIVSHCFQRREDTGHPILRIPGMHLSTMTVIYNVTDYIQLYKVNLTTTVKDWREGKRPGDVTID